MAGFLKVVGVGLLALLVLLAVLVGGFFGYRAHKQSANAKAMAITTPNGIQESMFIKVGNTEQWIVIRGQDRNNPVLLFLDGGPGSAASPFLPSRWEKDFVVVEWDQPGAGKTFGRGGGKIDPRLTIDQMVLDGITVAEFLRNHLHKNRIGLHASSWGTTIGINMIKQRPELFYAYAGTGQNVNVMRAEAIGYDLVLAKARAKNDANAVAELEAVGPPPYASATEFRTQRKWAAAYEPGNPSTTTLISALLYAPGYTLKDVGNWMQGFLASQDQFFGTNMKGPFTKVDLTALGPDFAVPVFIFQGTEDDYTPYVLAKEYADFINAPEKLFITATGAGHYAAITQSDLFGATVLKRVRELGLAADTNAAVSK